MNHQPALNIQSFISRQVSHWLKTAALAGMAVFLAGPLLAIAADAPARTFKLTAESPRFWKLLDRKAQLTRVAGDFGFTEGPVWDESGFLYVSDEEQNKIYRVFLDGRKEEVVSLGDPDGNTYDRQRRLIDCASVLRAIIAVTPEGKYTVLADRYEGKKLNSPNDVVTGPDGAIYFTDPTLDL
ncbi:MAG: SMP-30/gluconolactonase/LRE family protein, partial [Terriglobales bacterium]